MRGESYRNKGGVVEGEEDERDGYEWRGVRGEAR